MEVACQNRLQQRLLLQVSDEVARDRVAQLALVVAAPGFGDLAVEAFGVFGELHLRRQDERREERHVYAKDDRKTFLFLLGEERDLPFADSAEVIVERDEVDAVHASLGYVGLRPRSGYAPFDMGDLRVLATRALAGGFANLFGPLKRGNLHSGMKNLPKVIDLTCSNFQNLRLGLDTTRRIF